VVAAEKQLADAAELAAKMQMAERPAPQDADEPAESTQPVETARPTRQAKSDPKPSERTAETKKPQAEKPTRQASKRAERIARAQREEQRRNDRIAREAREKAEKLARNRDAAKPAAKLARTVPQSESVEYATPVAPTEPVAAVPAEQGLAVHADAHAEPVKTAPSNGFVLASAGDYRIGIDARQFERVTAPAAATAAPSEPGSNLEDVSGKGNAHQTANAVAAAEGTPTQRASQLFFGGAPMGKKVGNIEPWKPGSSPRLGDGDVATGNGAEVKLAALPPAGSTTDSAVMPGNSPDQSIGKDPNANGGQTIAPKGEVTGADKRPMTPAERLGLNDEKSRAKSVKCLTEVIYFESRGEVVRGQMAVAQVVLNRAFSGKYPNTVCGVVYQNAHRHLACQFTFACDGIADKVKEPDMWERAVVIANEMLDGKIWLPEVGKATHYHAHWVHPGWVREMNKLHRVGVHTFYRPRNWGDGTNAPQWGDVSETQEVAKKLVEVARKP
jgi:spore germination cell wall hydrolase CwlJ-like protein